MLILLLVLFICVVVLLGAAFAIARHIRCGRDLPKGNRVVTVEISDSGVPGIKEIGQPQESAKVDL